jgi:tetratricopeptide (TPR) repeat protein
VRSHRQALALYRESEDRDGEASAFNGIGIVEGRQSRYADALQSLQQALALYQQVGDKDGEAQVRTNTGDIEENQGRHADALESYEQALLLYKQLGNQSRAAQITRSIEKVKATINGPVSPSPHPFATPQPSASPL